MFYFQDLVFCVFSNAIEVYSKLDWNHLKYLFNCNNLFYPLMRPNIMEVISL